MNRTHALFLTVAIAAVATPTGAEGTRPILELPDSPAPEDFFRAQVFEEPLIPIGHEPTRAENAALATALRDYTGRRDPDDFSSLTGFLDHRPDSPWAAALLTGLGIRYYNTAHYSRALDAWTRAWALGQRATNLQGKFLADRAVCELAGLYSRLGRLSELETLLKSVEQRMFIGAATERISLAREALWMMQNQPGVSFRCGPLALQSIKRSLQPDAPGDRAIFNSTSTQEGFSLSQLAELSKTVGLGYQMAFRSSTAVPVAGLGRVAPPAAGTSDARTGTTRKPTGEDARAAHGAVGDFIVPSVVHWKVGHYAALVRQVGNQYLLEDPTFGNSVWATKQALEAETSGYFLIPPGHLPQGWRSVDAREGATVWGKGITSGNDADNYTEDDLQTGQCEMENAGEPESMGMAVSRVHMMLANLQVRDTPIGYTPPVGPPVRFTVRYNHRDYVYPVSLRSTLLGPKWTHDWNAAITDDPSRPLADVKYIVGGGGGRTFTGFNTNTQTFAPQPYDHTRLTRIGTTHFATYEMLYPDGSKKIFGKRVGVAAVLLTQVVDRAGNAVTLTYDPDRELLVAITDAIGQVTTITYENNLITRVTDPFGRFATFEYTSFYLLCGQDPNGIPKTCPVDILGKITDVAGLVSRFEYNQDIMRRMITPYGTNSFTLGNGPSANATMRFAETLYPDGSRDRVEYNQSDRVGVPNSEPASTVPQGMSAVSTYMYARNTYYWTRSACAMAYGDYTKAKIYHWLHAANSASTAGILESVKEPLEGRVWYDYDGQAGPHVVGPTDKPRHIGRVLDDGTTQLYTYGYNRFGKLTNSVDPLGRRLSFIYDANSIDLLEIRQTRAANNELLFQATYNAQHLPLTIIDAARQTNTYTYNARGQILTSTNPKAETTAYTYNTDGFLIAIDGPLLGTNDRITATYDSFGRVRTVSGASASTLVLDYDALDRIIRVAHPDSTFSQYTYDRLDLVNIRHRDGRSTSLEYDNARQLKKQTDPSGREMLFSWCRCGAIKSLIDPMGRATAWHHDVQGRLVSKQYSDGSKIDYLYEDTISRLRQVVDENQQGANYAYHLDNTLKSSSYVNTTIPTPGVTYGYDTNYQRVISLTDGTGTTRYSYVPISATPTWGAGRLASIDGPLPNDTITYGYDPLGRHVSRAIDGVTSTMAYDAAGRVLGETNVLGAFAQAYDSASRRLLARSLPNGQVEERQYNGNSLDQTLQRITHRIGSTQIAEFLYGYDVPAGRITTWSQQSGVQLPLLHTFGYDDADQLLTVTVTNAGALVNLFNYSYDLAGNRLVEQVATTNYAATYNALNQINTSAAPGTSRTNGWDAQERLVVVDAGQQRTELTYDGLSRLVALRRLTNGVEASFRRLVWCGGDICEERDASGMVTKRFFRQGVAVETGPDAGNYFYTRDHLGSIREVTDGAGSVRARYAYDPYGRRTRVMGDLEADFGFAGMFWSPEAGLWLTHYRAYDPELGRWLSRDPLENAEMREGPNLYAYVANNPINLIDPTGLISTLKSCLTPVNAAACAAAGITAIRTVATVVQRAGPAVQAAGQRIAACGGAVAGRALAIAERVPEAIRQTIEYFDDLANYAAGGLPSGNRMLNLSRYGAYPGYPEFLTEMDIAFWDIAKAIAAQHGVTVEQAAEWLMRFSGFKPWAG